jgi:membrane protein implicated in regulation of membrane protease activity
MKGSLSLKGLLLQGGIAGWLVNQSLSLLLLLAGAALVIMEAFAPGAHFIVLGIALLVAGLAGVLLPSLVTPIVLAVLVLVVGGVTMYGYRQFDLYGGKGSGKTTDSDSLKGQTGRVTERVSPRDGEVKLDEGGFSPYYAARTMDGEIEEGTEVMVTDPGGGNVVTVQAVGGLGTDSIDRELEREARRQASSDETDGAREAAEPDTERESDDRELETE